METTGNSIADRVRSGVKAFGLQKQLALQLGMNDAELSKFLEGQLPKFARLLAALELDVVDAGHVRDLKRILKAVL
jgi:hypothetical protein